MMKQRFEALSRICLNNWHYISKKTLSFSQGINFFTGHSGSGKSTVIDAMQVILYANTDGRGFFNKAAADDSDRNLIEYLRGMVNIGENNEFAYLRNQNFSSTIVLELTRTDDETCQCVGIVFDVETKTNEINRRFFWHKGPLWENGYRNESRTMSVSEVETCLKSSYSSEDYFYTSHNERFRRQLYEGYLGGLDSEKFPLLFKRAIPFRMNIKLEDFVKEYICMEQEIHIEDMQESVMQYGRMRKRIEDTCQEIEVLKSMESKYGLVKEKEQKAEQYEYAAKRMEILELRDRIQETKDRFSAFQADLTLQEEWKQTLEGQIEELAKKSDELLTQISSTGYEELKSQLASLNELVEQLTKSKGKWIQTAKGLSLWSDREITSNQTIWDMEAFEKGQISGPELERLIRSLEEMRKETDQLRQETSSSIRELKRQEKQIREELAQLKAGNKAYPRYLEDARDYIQRRLLEETGKGTEVFVLADLLEIKQDQWRNAVEGYLGSNKLSLVVPPSFAAAALKIYGELDKKIYCRVALLDTEQAAAQESKVLEHALSEEVTSREGYLVPYLNSLLGKVVKCQSVEELRGCRIGITSDCMLYHSFRLQHINPEHYTKHAYIGKDSVRKRAGILEKELKRIEKEGEPLEHLLKECQEILELECLGQGLDTYLEWQGDMESLRKKEKEKKKLEQKLEQLKDEEEYLTRWQQEREAVLALGDGKKRELDVVKLKISDKKRELDRLQKESIQLADLLKEKENGLETHAGYEVFLAEERKAYEIPKYDRLRERYEKLAAKAMDEREDQFQSLMEIRVDYARQYPNRNFSPTARENTAYETLLEKLECENLLEYRQKAGDQAKAAAEHFKDDFMYKIRSAIKEAIRRKDELNRIISNLDFGKDKYQFVIAKNKGADGRFYDMFMDDSLDVNPAGLFDAFENQVNFFTMEHEDRFEDLIQELIRIFIPPDYATPEQLEEAKRNMEKYADYRTYLSFDMQQLIQNEDQVIKIRLSKMLKKNSGGEGQNPLYVALLASFAQAYKISLSPNIQRTPTIRLVVLDEAFSKMDGEKVASCIQLIRGLGFQAIISATNDKIQNYVENVDKTFVFANPNKKAISIQEFEKDKMPQLMKTI